MSQELRRRLASRRRWMATADAELPSALFIRRFSEGVEREAGRPSKLHVGRFSDGLEALPEEAPKKAHVGRFSDGLEALPDEAPSKLHLGRFSEGVESRNRWEARRAAR
jgi:hypothetical protein